MILKHIILACILILFSSNLIANDYNNLSVEEALRLALSAREGKTQDIKKQLSIAELQKKVADSAYDLQAKVGLTYTHTNSIIDTPIVADDKYHDYLTLLDAKRPYIFSSGTSFEPYMNVNITKKLKNNMSEYSSLIRAGFSIVQPLTNEQRVANLARINQSEITYRIACINYQKELDDLLFNTIQTYFSVIAIDWNKQIISKQIALTKQLLEIGKINFRKGAISEQDVFNLEANLAINENALLQEENNYEIGLAALQDYIGKEITIVSFEATVPSIDSSISFTKEDLLRNNYNIKIGKLSRELLKINLDSVMAEDDLTFSVGGSFQRAGNSERLKDTVQEKHDTVLLNILLSKSIMDGDQNTSKVGIAQKSLEIFDSSYAQQKDKLQKTFTNLQKAMNQNKQQILLLAKSYEMAYKAYKISELKYQKGLVESASVVNSQIILINSELSLKKAQINLFLNYSTILNLSGQIRQLIINKDGFNEI